MACVIESVSALASGTRTNSTVTAPSGIVDGNILVYGMILGHQTSVPTPTPPTGFTAPNGIPFSYTWSGVDTYTVRLYFWTKKAASESGNYTVTHSSADSTAFMWRISGADQTTWVDQDPTSAGNDGGGAAGNIVEAPTQTPSVDGCGLLWFGGTWDAFGSATPTTGWTERRNVSTEAFYAQDLIQVTAAATGTISVTSTQNTNRPERAVMLAIRAAVGGGGSELLPKLMQHGLYAGGVL